ncbi:hypothetical protein DFH09DRAFT_1114146 [Mycena vulgaris]|nr:hypothetical protein DFH09DRAFT_1114146 [Mycena vulgaris]
MIPGDGRGRQTRELECCEMSTMKGSRSQDVEVMGVVWMTTWWSAEKFGWKNSWTPAGRFVGSGFEEDDYDLIDPARANVRALWRCIDDGRRLQPRADTSPLTSSSMSANVLSLSQHLHWTSTCKPPPCAITNQDWLGYLLLKLSTQPIVRIAELLISLPNHLSIALDSVSDMEKLQRWNVVAIGWEFRCETTTLFLVHFGSALDSVGMVWCPGAQGCSDNNQSRTFVYLFDAAMRQLSRGEWATLQDVPIDLIDETIWNARYEGATAASDQYKDAASKS